MKILSPNETIEMLGNKEEFKKNVCPECHRVFSPVDNRDCRTCLEQEAENRFGKFDEDEEDDMEENNKLDLMESQMADCEFED